MLQQFHCIIANVQDSVGAYFTGFRITLADGASCRHCMRSFVLAQPLCIVWDNAAGTRVSTRMADSVGCCIPRSRIMQPIRQHHLVCDPFHSNTHLVPGTTACGEMGSMNIPGLDMRTDNFTFNSGEYLVSFFFSGKSMEQTVTQLTIQTNQGREK